MLLPWRETDRGDSSARNSKTIPWRDRNPIIVEPQVNQGVLLDSDGMQRVKQTQNFRVREPLIFC